MREFSEAVTDARLLRVPSDILKPAAHVRSHTGNPIVSMG